PTFRPGNLLQRYTELFSHMPGTCSTSFRALSDGATLIRPTTDGAWSRIFPHCAALHAGYEVDHNSQFTIHRPHIPHLIPPIHPSGHRALQACPANPPVP